MGRATAPPTKLHNFNADEGMSNNILEMRHITKTFPGVLALDDVTMTVERGEIHAICGENGAGKSTLMKVLSGVWAHGSYEGDIVYEGEVCEFKNIRESEAKGIVRPAVHRDHIVPLSEGGLDEPGNTQGLCAECHEGKSLAERLRAQARSRT